MLYILCKLIVDTGCYICYTVFRDKQQGDKMKSIKEVILEELRELLEKLSTEKQKEIIRKTIKIIEEQ